jgi:hypothetical protein
MTATITYCLTEAAQRAQMVATGQPVARKQQHTIEVTADDLPYLAAAEDGSLSRDLDTLRLRWSDYPVPAQTTLDGAEAWRIYRTAFAAKLAELEAEDAKKEADAVALQDQNIADFLGGKEGNWFVLLTNPQISNPWGRNVPLDHPQAPAILARITAQAEEKKAKDLADGEALYQRLLTDPTSRFYFAGQAHAYFKGETTNLSLPKGHPRTAEFIAELTRRKEADEAAKIAREQAKTAYIAEWIASNADADTQAQFADGLLCRSAAVALIANAAFVAAGVGEEIADSVVCDNSDCPCQDKVLDCIPRRRIYPTWRTIKAGLPKASTAEFRKVRDCRREEVDRGYDDAADTAGPVYYAAIITIPHGPFSFTRRVRLG